ncbi:calpain-5-like [Oryzias melastigma]|uniref:calpain-5-like n=1 Tax=Oryzias melastigma TaxID=30732 RepID=UPI00168D7EF4|nr:calpain-5-like [Oryzias melastigma]
MGDQPFLHYRSVCMSCNLPKGRYVVIPSTYDPGLQGEFMLRIFTHEGSSCRELTEEEPKKENRQWNRLQQPDVHSNVQELPHINPK